jgi:alanine racemase
LGIGYADGLPPSATGARVRIGGALFPIVGEICMDRTFLDIDALPLKEGSAVTLFGESASDTARFAAECGISPYVLLSVRSPRTARVISP